MAGLNIHMSTPERHNCEVKSVEKSLQDNRIRQAVTVVTYGAEHFLLPNANISANVRR